METPDKDKKPPVGPRYIVVSKHCRGLADTGVSQEQREFLHLDRLTSAVAQRALLEMQIPKGWLPKSVSDPILVQAFQGRSFCGHLE